jgi:hypothetical protein
VNDILSLRSAPAQKHPSTLLVNTRARTAELSDDPPLRGNKDRFSISAFKSPSKRLDIAFLASGRSSLRTLIVPQCGAGNDSELIRDGAAE